jgi:hypothetical protein
MKFLILPLILISTMASAQRIQKTCPIGTKAIVRCDSTPKAGDHELAIMFADWIVVCAGPVNKYHFLIKTADITDVVSGVTAVARPGGASFSVRQKDMRLTLAMATATGHTVKPAKIHLEFLESKLTASSTYSCQ